MVAPLDVHAVVVQQGIHDDVRPGAPVKNVAHDVQVIHRHAFDQPTHRLDESGGLVRIDDGVDDILKVVPLVDLFPVGMEQFLDDVAVILGQGLADLGAGIFGRDQPAELHQLVEGDPVPLLQVVRIPADPLQLFPGIINQSGQLASLRLGQSGEKQLVHLLLHHAGAGVEDVQKRLILPVDIGDEMLRALGQIQDGLEVDDLSAGCLNSGILAGQHVQIA